MSGMRAFRAIVRKELAEAAKPGAIAFAVVAAGLIYSLSDRERTLAEMGVYRADMFPTTLFTMTSVAAALVIGAAQMYRERRGDMWAFLTHRPVSRAALFWGKVVAGVAVYVVAAGLPLAVSFAWRSMPGHSPAPFVPAMMLPAVADLCCALVYYFAALLIAMRTARWYATWIFPALTAFVCSMLETSAATFGGSLERIAPLLLVMIVASCSVFVAGGAYDAQSRLGRVALGLCVTPALVVAAGIPAAALSVALEVHAPPPPATSALNYTETAAAGDGQLVRATWATQPGSDGRKLVDVRAIDGARLPALEDSVRRLGRVDVGVIATAQIPLNLDGHYSETARRGYRGTEDIFVPLLRNPLFGRTSWFYMRRLGLVDVYHAGQTGSRHVGWIGPDGFVAGDAPPAHRFAGSLRPYVLDDNEQPLIVLPREVYRFDPDNRTIAKVFDAPPGEEIVGAATSGDSTATVTYGPRARFDAIATTKRVYIQSRDGTSRMSVPRDSVAAKYGTVIVERGMLDGGRHTTLSYSRTYGALTPAEYDSSATQLIAYDDRGDVLMRAAERLAGSDVRAPMQWAHIGVVSLFQPVALSKFLSVSFDDDVTGRAPSQQRAATMVGIVASAFGSIVAVLIVLFVGRRYAFDWRRIALWTVIAVAIGLMGAFLMLALLDFPARVACPSCRAPRVVTRDQCEHCGAAFDPPPADGTEILEPAA